MNRHDPHGAGRRLFDPGLFDAIRELRGTERRGGIVGSGQHAEPAKPGPLPRPAGRPKNAGPALDAVLVAMQSQFFPDLQGGCRRCVRIHPGSKSTGPGQRRMSDMEAPDGVTRVIGKPQNRLDQLDCGRRGELDAAFLTGGNSASRQVVDDPSHHFILAGQDSNREIGSSSENLSHAIHDFADAVFTASLRAGCISTTDLEADVSGQPIEGR